MKIIVDAMGGDNAPLEIIKGSMLAVDEFGVDIVLVGDEDKINKCVSENKITLKNTEIVDTKGVITMTDDAKSVLKGRFKYGSRFQAPQRGQGRCIRFCRQHGCGYGWRNADYKKN